MIYLITTANDFVLLYEKRRCIEKLAVFGLRAVKIYGSCVSAASRPVFF